VKQYQAMEFEQALEHFRAARVLPHSAVQDVQISLYEGILYFELGNLPLGKQSLRSALLVDVQARFPVQVSPRISGALEVERRKAMAEGATPLAPPPPEPAVAPAPTSEAKPSVTVEFQAHRPGDSFQLLINRSAACPVPCRVPVPAGFHSVEVSGDASFHETLFVPVSATPVQAVVHRRRGGFLALGITSLSVGVVAALLGTGTLVGALNLADPPDRNAVGGALLGGGLAVALAGSLTGFLLMDGNGISTAPAPSPATGPRVTSVGVAPVRGGAVVGATVGF